MTAHTDDLDHRARRIRVACGNIDMALMRRPGAVAPGEHRDAMAMLNDVARGCPMIQYAPAERQVAIAENWLQLWQSMLDSDADMLWPDPDDEDR